MKRLALASQALLVGLCVGCTITPPPPLSYLAVERPTGVIRTGDSSPVTETFSRGGWYFGNHNFRPAPDVSSYLGQVSHGVLRNADVQLNVPFAFDILFFGYNGGTDTVTAAGK